MKFYFDENLYEICHSMNIVYLGSFTFTSIIPPLHEFLTLSTLSS